MTESLFEKMVQDRVFTREELDRWQYQFTDMYSDHSPRFPKQADLEAPQKVCYRATARLVPRVAFAWHSSAADADVLDYTRTSYMSKAHNPTILLSTFKALVPEDLEFDTLVGTGLSGTLAVAELARKLDKNYLVVRKENDGSHSQYPVEGRLGRRWLFVDDTVASGCTFRRVWRVVDELRHARQFQTEYVGRMLYTDLSFYRAPSNAGDCLLNDRNVS